MKPSGAPSIQKTIIAAAAGRTQDFPQAHDADDDWLISAFRIAPDACQKKQHKGSDDTDDLWQSAAAMKKDVKGLGDREELLLAAASLLAI
jgi:hypothetical protein